MFTWFSREQRARASILLELARQLYRRERGAAPTSDRDLVGPYLDRLPDGAVNPGPPSP